MVVCKMLQTRLRLQLKDYLNSDRKLDAQGSFGTYAPAEASGVPKAVQLTLKLPLHLVTVTTLQTQQ